MVKVHSAILLKAYHQGRVIALRDAVAYCGVEAGLLCFIRHLSTTLGSIEAKKIGSVAMDHKTQSEKQ